MSVVPELAELPLALLAGGRGTRIRDVAGTVPKALLEVAGRPFIAHQLELLRRHGLRRVVLCVGYLGAQIEAYVGDGRRFGLHVDYSREGDRLLGTAGALRKAEPLLGSLFWVMYGDTYLDVDFARILTAFRRSPALGMMTVFRNDDRFDASNVLFENGRLLDYDKRAPRPEMRHIDYGLALLRREVLTRIPPDAEADLADLYRDLVAAGAMEGFEVDRRFYEIGSPQGLADTQRFLGRRE